MTFQESSGKALNTYRVNIPLKLQCGDAKSLHIDSLEKKGLLNQSDLRMQSGMNNTLPVPTGIFDTIEGIWFRLAATGWIPARWYLRDLPKTAPNPLSNRGLRLEIVSHCWGYAVFLIHQLNSLVRYPPKTIDLTMTVYYANSYEETLRVLRAYEDRALRWIFRTQGVPVEVPGLFRIRHLAKGRYSGSWSTSFRQMVRRIQSGQRWQTGIDRPSKNNP